MNRDEERTIASNVGSRTPHRVESCGYEPKRPSARIHSRRRPIATPSKGIPSNETPEGETLKGTSHDNYPLSPMGVFDSQMAVERLQRTGGWSHTGQRAKPVYESVGGLSVDSTLVAVI